MAKRIEKLNEKQLHKMISEAISEIADSNGYYDVLHYLHDIAGSEEGERIINGLYGDSAMEYENAIEELKSMFPTVRPNSLEAAIRSFERESNGNDRFVAESKKQVKLNEKQLRNMIAKSVKSVLKESFSNNDDFMCAYGIVQNALIEICNDCSCSPDDAKNLILQVFNTFDASDLVDED